MIYTLTLSPALDYIITMENFSADEVNRTEKEEIFAGGKGINVSLVLKNLEIENVALGFVAGFTGEKIERDLAEYGCFVDFVHLKQGMSRINIKIQGESTLNEPKKETEINGQGPDIPVEQLQKLFDKLDQINENDILVIAGSAPNTLPDDIYVEVIEHLKNKNIKVVMDAEKDLLLQVLPYHPFLIKPNRRELEDLFGVEITEKDDILKYAKELQNQGARNVLVSLSEDGAVLVTEDGKVMWRESPKGEVVNAVGTGNSMVAGFLAGYLDGEDYEKAFAMAVAAGSACAFTNGLPKRADIMKLL